LIRRREDDDDDDGDGDDKDDNETPLALLLLLLIQLLPVVMNDGREMKAPNTVTTTGYLIQNNIKCWIDDFFGSMQRSNFFLCRVVIRKLSEATHFHTLQEK
jgi:hypothetical protein